MLTWRENHRRAQVEKAVRRFTPYVATVITRTLGGWACREDVEELTADVFLKLWERWDALDQSQNLGPWLATVARNRATDWLRCHRPGEALSPEFPDPAPGPAELTERRDWAARLWAAVDALPEPDRSLFLRYYYPEEKLKTIAGELGLSQSAAKQRLFRGRKALKARLREGGEE